MDFSRVPPDKLPVLMAKFFGKGPAAMIRARPVEDLVAPIRATMVEGKKLLYHPTQLPIARWVLTDRKIMEEGIENFNFGDFIVEQISEHFSLQALKPSPLFPQFGKAVATEDVVQRIATGIPEDGTEIVAWMHVDTATKVVNTAREEEYNVHSQFVTSSGDPNIPGVRTRSMSFRRIDGYTYNRQGYATVVSPAGSLNVPRLSLRPIIGNDFLGWAYAGTGYWCQWHGVLGEFTRLADRITQAVGFPNLFGRVAPFFVLQQPDRQTERARVRMIFNSDKPQRVRITFRDPNNYRRVIDEGWIDIPAGQSTVEYYVASYPAVPPVVNHMQPADGTRSVLNRFETLRG